jgi:hypothetical protein
MGLFDQIMGGLFGAPSGGAATGGARGAMSGGPQLGDIDNNIATSNAGNPSVTSGYTSPVAAPVTPVPAGAGDPGPNKWVNAFLTSGLGAAPAAKSSGGGGANSLTGVLKNLLGVDLSSYTGGK